MCSKPSKVFLGGRDGRKGSRAFVRESVSIERQEVAICSKL